MEDNNVLDIVGGDNNDDITAQDEEKVASLSGGVVDKATKLKADLDSQFGDMNNHNLAMTFGTTTGDVIQPRNSETGKMYLASIPKNKLVLGPREGFRKDTQDIEDLKDSIKDMGLLTPLHVVPKGRGSIQEIGKDENGEPIFSKVYGSYIILDGARRFNAMINLNYQKMVCLVDSTIPMPLIASYTGLVNKNKEFKFSERLAMANMLREMFSTETMPSSGIERLAGYNTGEWYKALYINDMREDYPEFWNSAETGKLSISQSFDKLEKAIDKAGRDAEKEAQENQEGDEQANFGDEDITKGEDDSLQKANDKYGTQNVGNRHILDTGVRRTVESRDNGKCQVCGYPEVLNDKGELKKYPDISGQLQVEHLLEVQYFSKNAAETDDPNRNLYLICENCHNLVNRYESGQYIPLEDSLKDNLFLRKIVVIGNMKIKQKQEALKFLKAHDKNQYNQVQKGKITVGRALLKIKDKFNPYDIFDKNPLDIMFGEFKKLDSKQEASKELSANIWDVEDDEELNEAKKVASYDINQEEDALNDMNIAEQQMASSLNKAYEDSHSAQMNGGFDIRE